MKKHVGRPTNEEVKRRKIKKAITVILPVAVIVIAVIAIASSGSLSKLMGNSVTEYYCEDSSYTLEGMECTKLIREKANLIGDINLDGRVDIQDQTEFQKYQAGTLVFNEKQEKVADINEDGAIDVNDMTMLQEYLGGDSGESTVGNPYSYVGKKFVCLDGYNLNGEYCEKKDIKKALAKTIDNPVEVTITDDKNGNTNITSGTKVTLDVKFKVNHASKKYYYMLKTYENDKQITQSDCLEVKEQTIKQDLNLSEGKEIKGIYTIYSNASCNVVVDRIETKAYKLNTSSNTTTNNQTNNTPTTTNKTFTIKYKANGGTGSMNDQIVTFGNKVSLSKNKFTRSKYVFNGWRIYNETKKQWSCYLNSEKSKYYYSDESNCKKYGYVTYKDQQKVAETGQPGETLTFYAQWNNKFVINYHANGGTGSMTRSKITYGTQTALKKNKFTRSGYSFNGWYAYNTNKKQWNCYKDSNKSKQGYSDEATCKKYGYVRYSDGVKVAYTGDIGETVTLYAQWKKNATTSNSSSSSSSNNSSNGASNQSSSNNKDNANKTKKYASIKNVGVSLAQDRSQWIFNISADKNDSKITGYCASAARKGANCQNFQSSSSVSIKAGTANDMSSICYSKGGKDISIYVTVRSEISGKTSYHTVTEQIHCNAGNEISATATYNCDKGWTKVGDGPTSYCQKQSGYKYTCPSGYTKVGDGDSAYCQKATGKSYTCPSGYTKVGDGPTAYCQKQSGYKYTCPSGYTKVGDGDSAYCQKVSSYSYTCPSGYTKVGDGPTAYCQKQSGYKYTCPSGWTMVGGGSSAYCQKASGYKYTCPSGWTMVGGGSSAYCQKASGYKYVCPSGYTQAGGGPSSTCIKGKGKNLKVTKVVKKTNYATKSTTKKTNYATTSTTKTKQYVTQKTTKKANYTKKSITKTKNYVTKKIVVKNTYAKKSINKSKNFVTKPISIEYKCGDDYMSYGAGSTKYCVKRDA